MQTRRAFMNGVAVSVVSLNLSAQAPACWKRRHCRASIPASPCASSPDGAAVPRADRQWLRNLPVTLGSPYIKHHTLQKDFPVGDCYLSRYYTTAHFFSDGRVFVYGWTLTTKGPDYWHNYFLLKDRNGAVLMIRPRTPLLIELRGPDMPENNHWYLNELWYAPSPPNDAMKMMASFFPLLTYVDWGGEC
jgi:hypothetical protein